MTRSSLTIFTILLVCLIAFATFTGIYKIRESRLLNSSEQFALGFSENFLTSWDIDFFLANCSAEYCSKLPIEAFQLMISNMKRIGNLQTINNSQGELRDLFIFSNGDVTATYRMASSFELADAEINIELVQQAGDWKLNNFYLNSSFLAD